MFRFPLISTSTSIPRVFDWFCLSNMTQYIHLVTLVFLEIFSFSLILHFWSLYLCLLPESDYNDRNFYLLLPYSDLFTRRRPSTFLSRLRDHLGTLPCVGTFTELVLGPLWWRSKSGGLNILLCKHNKVDDSNVIDLNIIVVILWVCFRFSVF